MATPVEAQGDGSCSLVFGNRGPECEAARVEDGEILASRGSCWDGHRSFEEREFEFSGNGGIPEGSGRGRHKKGGAGARPEVRMMVKKLEEGLE